MGHAFRRQPEGVLYCAYQRPRLYCNAIKQTPDVAVPPRDRLYLMENCAWPLAECAAKGSARARWLERRAKEVREQVRQALETERLRREKEEEAQERACLPVRVALGTALMADQAAQARRRDAWTVKARPH